MPPLHRYEWLGVVLCGKINWTRPHGTTRDHTGTPLASCRAPDIFRSDPEHHSGSRAKSGFSDLP